MKIGKYAAILLLLVTSFLIAQSSGNLVTVEGYGMNKQQALDDAYRRALERIIGAWIKAQTKVKDMTPIEDLVISRVSGYVKLKKITSIDYDENTGIYKVVVDVEVFEKDIKEKLKDLLAEAGSPSIGIIIKEEFSPKEGKCGYSLPPLFLASAGINGKLSEEGVVVQDISSLSEYNEVLKKSGASDKDLIKVSQAAANIASYVLYLKANYYSRYVEEYDVCSVRLNLEGKLVRADTGEVVKAYAFSEVMAGGSPEAAINRILKKIVPKVAERVAEDIYFDRVIRALSDKNIKVRFDLFSPEVAGEIKDCVVDNYIDAKKVTVVNNMGNVLILSLLTMDKPDSVWRKLKKICSDFEMELVNQSSNFVEIKIISQLNKNPEVVYLKFDLAKYSLINKVKGCLSKIDGVEVVGRTSYKPYTLKVKLSTDLESLIDSLISCEDFQAEVEDIAEDGSWVLFNIR